MQPEFLRSVSLFEDLSEAQLEALGSLFSVRDIAPREAIVMEGEPMHEFYVVCEGTVHVRRMAQNREMLLGRIATGGFFGEINLFEEGAATASIYATDAVKLAAASDAALCELMNANPEVGYKVLARLLTELSRRLRQTNERFVSAMYWSSLSASESSSEG